MELYRKISGFVANLGSSVIKYTPEPIKRLVGYGDLRYQGNQAGVYQTAKDLLDLDDLIAPPFHKAARDKVKPQEQIWKKHVRYQEVNGERTKVKKEGVITMEGIESKLNDLRKSLRKAGILSNDDVLKLDVMLGEEQIVKAKELETYLLQEPIFDDLPNAYPILKAQLLLQTYHEITPRFVAASYGRDANHIGGRWSKPTGPIQFFPDGMQP